MTLRRSRTLWPASIRTRATTSGTSLSSRKRTQLLRRLCHLPRDQKINFTAMIFVVREAFVNLRAGNVGKTVRYGINRFAVLQKTDDVMDADARAFNPCVPAADSFRLHDVAIVRRGFHAGIISYALARSTSNLPGWKLVASRHSGPGKGNLRRFDL